MKDNEVKKNIQVSLCQFSKLIAKGKNRQVIVKRAIDMLNVNISVIIKEITEAELAARFDTDDLDAVGEDWQELAEGGAKRRHVVKRKIVHNSN